MPTFKTKSMVDDTGMKSKRYEVLRPKIRWKFRFKSDGNLMPVCGEREADVADFRRGLEEHLKFGFPGE